MKHRKEVPLREVLSVLDCRILRVKSHQRFLKTKKVPGDHKDFDCWFRKSGQLRVERFIFESLRRDLSRLRYGPGSVAELEALLKTT